ncbi:Plasmodium exported protein, unknown function, partial [Plasmodium vivax]
NFVNFGGTEENHVKIINTFLFRSLAKHGFKEESEHEKLKEKYSYDGDIKEAKNFSDARSTYGNLKNKELNELELYRKKYNHRYTNKKGLKKLDCYCENKIFDKFEYVNNFTEKTQNSKKRFIKIILNKYTIFLCLFALVPVLGLIVPWMFGHKSPKYPVLHLFFDECNTKHYKTEEPGVCKYPNIIHIPKDAARAMFYSNAIFTYTSLIAVMFIFFYIYVKYIKYLLLKEGIGNISIKEYFRLLKNTF